MFRVSKINKIIENNSDNEKKIKKYLTNSLLSNRIPNDELLDNLGVFLTRQSLSRFLFLNEIYKESINTHGSIFEFGVRWGQNTSLFSSFRGIYEPYNYNKKIISFDTFEGFPSIDKKDDVKISSKGDYSVTKGYEFFLNELIQNKENLSPLPHIKKYEIVKGDATKTLPKYLAEHPETIISLVYFDFDIYKPTKKCLELIKPYLTKGSIIGFDELNYDKFPGETIALREVLGTNRFSIKRFPFAPHCSYLKYE
jgi:hypothetical protein